MKTKAKPVADETLVQFHMSFDYPVRFTRDALSGASPDLSALLRRREPSRRHRVFFALDAGLVAARPSVPEAAQAYVKAHRGALALAAPPLIVPGGEEAKNRPGVAEWVRARLTAAGVDTRTHVVIVGGGAVLDAVGFSAATLHRGLRVTRLPTTLTAQADSGVGVTCAVNAAGRKNWIGSFHPPFGVLIDTKFLSSLSKRDRRGGMAEAVKAALARDRAFFHWITEHADSLARFERRSVETLVRWSARLHWEHLAQEGGPCEGANARRLDFGHWAAHKLETLTANEIGHGEAVAIGAAIDTLLSVLLTDLPAESGRAVLQTLARLGLPLWHEALEQVSEDGTLALLEGLADFQERLGQPSIQLLRRLGEARECDGVGEAAVAAAVAALSRWKNV